MTSTRSGCRRRDRRDELRGGRGNTATTSNGQAERGDEQRGRRDVGPQEPVGVRLAMDQVPDAAQPAARCRARRSAACRRSRSGTQPDDAGDRTDARARAPSIESVSARLSVVWTSDGSRRSPATASSGARSGAERPVRSRPRQASASRTARCEVPEVLVARRSARLTRRHGVRPLNSRSSSPSACRNQDSVVATWTSAAASARHRIFGHGAPRGSRGAAQRSVTPRPPRPGRARPGRGSSGWRRRASIEASVALPEVVATSAWNSASWRDPLALRRRGVHPVEQDPRARSSVAVVRSATRRVRVAAGSRMRRTRDELEREPFLHQLDGRGRCPRAAAPGGGSSRRCRRRAGRRGPARSRAPEPPRDGVARRAELAWRARPRAAGATPARARPVAIIARISLDGGFGERRRHDASSRGRVMVGRYSHRYSAREATRHPMYEADYCAGVIMSTRRTTEWRRYTRLIWSMVLRMTSDESADRHGASRSSERPRWLRLGLVFLRVGPAIGLVLLIVVLSQLTPRVPDAHGTSATCWPSPR